MRLWHYRMLPYLPDAQLLGQVREAIAIMRQWRDKGKTNHLLINRVMDYPKSHLTTYYITHLAPAYLARFGKHPGYVEEFLNFSNREQLTTGKPFPGWHDDKYAMICLVNLLEKRLYGKGSGQITQEDYDRARYGARYSGNDGDEIYRFQIVLIDEKEEAARMAEKIAEKAAFDEFEMKGRFYK